MGNKELKANITDITQIKEICKDELLSFATDIYSNDVERQKALGRAVFVYEILTLLKD